MDDTAKHETAQSAPAEAFEITDLGEAKALTQGATDPNAMELHVSRIYKPLD